MSSQQLSVFEQYLLSRIHNLEGCLSSLVHNLKSINPLADGMLGSSDPFNSPTMSRDDMSRGSLRGEGIRATTLRRVLGPEAFEQWLTENNPRTFPRFENEQNNRLQKMVRACIPPGYYASDGYFKYGEQLEYPTIGQYHAHVDTPMPTGIYKGSFGHDRRHGNDGECVLVFEVKEPNHVYVAVDLSNLALQYFVYSKHEQQFVKISDARYLDPQYVDFEVLYQKVQAKLTEHPFYQTWKSVVPSALFEEFKQKLIDRGVTEARGFTNEDPEIGEVLWAAESSYQSGIYGRQPEPRSIDDIQRIAIRVENNLSLIIMPESACIENTYRKIEQQKNAHWANRSNTHGIDNVTNCTFDNVIAAARKTFDAFLDKLLTSNTDADTESVDSQETSA